VRVGTFIQRENALAIPTALPQKSKSHQRQLVDVSDATYQSDHQIASLIPPTAVGGYFTSSLAAETWELGGT